MSGLSIRRPCGVIYAQEVRVVCENFLVRLSGCGSFSAGIFAMPARCFVVGIVISLVVVFGFCCVGIVGYDGISGYYG